MLTSPEVVGAVEVVPEPVSGDEAGCRLVYLHGRADEGRGAHARLHTLLGGVAIAHTLQLLTQVRELIGVAYELVTLEARGRSAGL